MKRNIIFCLIACFLFTGCTSDQNVKKIMNAAKVNQKTAEKIVSILQSVGVQNINYVTCKAYPNRKTCTVKNYDLLFEDVFVSLSSDGTVELINAKNILYENNKILSNIYDNMTSKDDFLYLINDSKQKTLQALKAPASATFPDWKEWKFEISKDTVSFSAFVDSQNSFGATIRTPINFIYNRKKKDNNNFEYSFKSATIGNINIS